MSPQPQWVPNAALKKAHQNQKILLSVVGLNNLSSKVLSSIRVKLPFAPAYEPAIQVSGSASSVGARYLPACHQIEIQKLDPNEKIYIAIFLSSEESKGFSEPQVIVGEKLLSRGMRAIGYFKKFPKEEFFSES